MDPLDPASFEHRTALLSTGRTYHFVDQQPGGFDPTTTPTIFCVHGFPDLWYGWRYQIGPWTSKGYRVVVPDMLGYGGTDKPLDTIEYTTKRLSDDLAALLDYLNIKKAIIIGHDWGAYTVGRFALWHPERLLALIMLSVPFTPPNLSYVPIEDIAKRIPQLRYQLYFTSPESNQEIENNLSGFLRTSYCVPNGRDLIQLREQFTDESQVDKQPVLLNIMELEYYVHNLGQGMHGPLSYYRTSKFRFEEEKAARLSSSLHPDLPVLFMWGTLDPIAIPAHIERARKLIPKLQNISFHGKGHWLMVEAKEEVTMGVLDWLDAHDIVPTTAKSRL